jgi:hypothetical protein
MDYAGLHISGHRSGIAQRLLVTAFLIQLMIGGLDWSPLKTIVLFAFAVYASLHISSMSGFRLVAATIASYPSYLLSHEYVFQLQNESPVSPLRALLIVGVLINLLTIMFVWRLLPPSVDYRVLRISGRSARHALAGAYLVTGYLVFGLGMLDLVALPNLGDSIRGALRVGLAAVGFTVAKRGERLLLPDAETLRRIDPRPPILYLRSFADEEMVARMFSSFGIRRDIRESTTFEEFAIRVIGKYGPVIALGRPEEDLPPFGAAREYVAGHEWRAAFGRLVHEARRVVLVLGVTEGLKTEIQLIVRERLGKKLVVLIPPLSINEKQRRWGAFVGEVTRALEGEESAARKPSTAAEGEATSHPPERSATPEQMRRDEGRVSWVNLVAVTFHEDWSYSAHATTGPSEQAYHVVLEQAMGSESPTERY